MIEWGIDQCYGISRTYSTEWVWRIVERFKTKEEAINRIWVLRKYYSETEKKIPKFRLVKLTYEDV